mmetsp:Transcript_4125/g.7904  ORF Transcript_4125/g.7904 Transcript_4125/m.7904 type:complete len:222 (-) Transcript_4125:1045-1710(-)
MKQTVTIKIIDSIITNLNFNCIIKNVNYYFLNTVRNFLIIRIINYSIKTIIFFFNTTVISDEVIAHRIGLIPFTNNCLFEKIYYYKEIGKIFFEINYMCFKEKIHLLSSNSILIDKNFPLLHPCNYFLNNEDKNILEKRGYLITKLKKSQTLYIKMYLGKNEGASHAKWSLCSGNLFLKLPVLKWNFLIMKAVNFFEKSNLNKIIVKYKKKIQFNYTEVVF